MGDFRSKKIKKKKSPILSNVNEKKDRKKLEFWREEERREIGYNFWNDRVNPKLW